MVYISVLCLLFAPCFGTTLTNCTLDEIMSTSCIHGACMTRERVIGGRFPLCQCHVSYTGLRCEYSVLPEYLFGNTGFILLVAIGVIVLLTSGAAILLLLTNIRKNGLTGICSQSASVV